MRKKFYVKPDDGVVVARYEVGHAPSIDEEIFHGGKCCESTKDLMGNFSLLFTRKDLPIDSLKAIAVCDDEDSFDENAGKDIAGSKLDLKYHMKLAKQYERLLTVLIRAMGELNNLANYHWEKVKNIQDDLDRCYNK